MATWVFPVAILLATSSSFSTEASDIVLGIGSLGLGVVTVGAGAFVATQGMRFGKEGAACAGCGYDLSGAESARCPECGSSLATPQAVVCGRSSRRLPIALGFLVCAVGLLVTSFAVMMLL